MLSFTISEVRGAILGVVGTLLVGGLGWLWARGRPKVVAWNARQAESDAQAARRLVGNTQRLVGFIGVFLFMTLGTLSFSAGTVCAWAVFTHRLPVWCGLLAGMMFGEGLICLLCLRFLVRVADVLNEEEKQRQRLMN